MAYLLHYKMRFERNNGTEEEPNIVEYFQECSIGATDADYDVQMAFAKAEAYNGEVTVEEVPDSEEPIAPTDSSVWDELDAAYQEGVDSV
jgi:hypothetical protein